MPAFSPTVANAPKIFFMVSGLLFATGCAVKADNIVERDKGDEEWVVFDDSELISESDDVAIDDDDGDEKSGKDKSSEDNEADVENEGPAVDDSEMDAIGDSELIDDANPMRDSDATNDVSTEAIIDSAAIADTETGPMGDAADDSEDIDDFGTDLGSDDSGTAADTDFLDTGVEIDSVTMDDSATSTDTAFTDTASDIDAADTIADDTQTEMDTETATADTSIIDTSDTNDTNDTNDTQIDTVTETDTDTGIERDSETDSASDADAGIYVTFDSVWQGYGWVTTGAAEGGVINEGIDAGKYELGMDPLCISGATAADFESQGGIGFNLNQAEGASGDDAALWVPSLATTIIRYDIVTNTPLRIEIVNVDDGLETAYCTEIPDTGNLTGYMVFRNFQTNCWENGDNVPYTSPTGLLRILVYAPGAESGVVDFDFCINDLHPE